MCRRFDPAPHHQPKILQPILAAGFFFQDAGSNVQSLTNQQIQLPLFMRPLLLILLTFLGITAAYGGWLLMKDPTGSIIQLPSQWIAQTLFKNYFIPGIILFLVLGLGSFVSAVVAFRAKSAAAYLPAIAQGLAVLVWLAVQLLVIRQTFFLQGVYAVLGLLMLWLAWRLYTRAKHF